MPKTEIPEKSESAQIFVFDVLRQEKWSSLFRTIPPLSRFNLERNIPVRKTICHSGHKIGNATYP
jgi:hypothetical protein